MKLAILCVSPSWGGLEINIFNLAKWLHARGHELLLLAEDDSRIFRFAEDAGIPCLDFPHRRKHLNLRRAYALGKLLKDKGFKHLLIGHYHQFYTGVLAGFLHPRAFYVMYLQQMQMNVYKKDPYHTFFYRHLDVWVSPLDYLIRQLQEQTDMKRDKIFKIPLCIETERFIRVSALKSEARQLFKLPEDAFLIGVIGRLDAQKGQEYLLKALELIHQEGFRWHALLMGEETTPGYEAYLQDLARELGLENFVHFRPFSSETPMAFAALDVFAMTSLSEPFGMVTVEAMAVGRPVVGTERGGTIELLENGEAGLLVEPAQPEALAAALKKLYLEPEFSKKLSKKAQETALQKYNHLIHCEGWELLLAKLT